MQKFIYIFLVFLSLSKNAYTKNQPQLPEVILFYNSLYPCLNCPQIKQQITDIITQNYSPFTFYFKTIDLKNYPHYTNIFNLSPPLNLVLISYYDGFYNGYKKLPYSILNQNDIISLSNLITTSINDFFNLLPINYQKISNY